MDSTLGRASTTENCNENENDAIFLFKPAVLIAIKTIRSKKKRAHKESIFDLSYQIFSIKYRNRTIRTCSNNTYQEQSSD